MILLPRDFSKWLGRATRIALLAGLCSIISAQAADTDREEPPTEDDGALPQPLKADAFAPLMASPPFTRSLGISDSLILTGIARLDNHIVATLLDTETMQSHLVSQTPNHEGWQLVGVGGDQAKMNTWSARIQIRGGEVVTVRYQTPPPRRSRTSSGGSYSGGGPGGSSSSTPLSTRQVEEARNAAVNYREGFSGDGYPRQPPPEVVEKLSRLSVGQREEINRQMIGLFSRGMGMEQRRRIYDDMVNRASQGRR